MIVQTQNSTYIVQWMGLPIKGRKRWGLYRYSKAPAQDVKGYCRNLGKADYEGDTLTLGIGSEMILMQEGREVIKTSRVLDIE